MRLEAVYTRFYRAFNFDYLRASSPTVSPSPWDTMDDGRIRPYITVSIDPELTCIVGANEAGKSQLLDAIEFAFGIESPENADFCRYSDYFNVREATLQPHFGVKFGKLTLDEISKLEKITDTQIPASASFHIFRTSADRVRVFVDGVEHDGAALESFTGLLPHIVRINPDRALPNSVPLAYLASGGSAQSITRQMWRPAIGPALDNVPQLLPCLDNAEELAKRVRQVFGLSDGAPSLSQDEQERLDSELQLAFDLLVTVGGISVGSFKALQDALNMENEGYANGIRGEMNNQLERSLNLSKWWSQDRDFRLEIDVREFDLVFTVRDRTGSSYSFGERSGGLKYFLSYLVQSLAHMKHRTGPEVLLMDEPDAYLSNQGQQDLLRVLKEFTVDTSTVRGGQVVFVTHSPFLIDKNRADRIRVLDKGSGDEGVRVVRDIGHNRFEPLRTAMGSFVGETVFMGNCNIVVEGVSDQVLLAGMSALLDIGGKDYDERLDLNRVTLVPAGGAQNVYYITYLARGRGVEKPAVVVLLDGDSAGDDAVRELTQKRKGQKRILKEDYILQIKTDDIDDLESDCSRGPIETEDLVALDVAFAAVENYAREVGFDVSDVSEFQREVTELVSDSHNLGLFEAINSALETTQEHRFRIEKFPFSRHVVDVCSLGTEPSIDKASIDRTCDRFALLLRHLTAKQRMADRERDRKTIEGRVKRETSGFIRDYHSPTKMDLKLLLERIEAVVDDAEEGDKLLTDIRRLREDYQLGLNLNEAIADLVGLRRRLAELEYAERRALQASDSEQHADDEDVAECDGEDEDSDDPSSSITE